MWRRAIAAGEIREAGNPGRYKNRKIVKGEVLRLAPNCGIMAVKKTPLLIPMVHNIPITSIGCPRLEMGAESIWQSWR